MQREMDIGRSLLTPINQVLDHLFIGNRQAALNKNILTEHNITHIVQLQEQTDEPFYPGEYEYYCSRIGDLSECNIELILPRALHFIHTAISEGKNVLVHCNAGVSRSGSVVIAYIMAINQWNFQRASQFVMERRPCVCPNDGFERQLSNIALEEMRSWLY